MMFLPNDDTPIPCVEYVKEGKDYWFGSGDKQTMHDISAAKMLCSGCPVNLACLSRVLAMPVLPSVGVWAGKTPEELEQIRQPGEWRTCAYSGCGALFHVRRRQSTKRFCTPKCVYDQQLEIAHAR